MAIDRRSIPGGASRVRVLRATAAIGAAGALCALWLVGAAAGSGDSPPAPARVAASGEHRVWVGDRVWHHSALWDGDTGQVLGMIDGPTVTVTPKLPLHAHRR